MRISRFSTRCLRRFSSQSVAGLIRPQPLRLIETKLVACPPPCWPAARRPAGSHSSTLSAICAVSSGLCRGALSSAALFDEAAALTGNALASRTALDVSDRRPTLMWQPDLRWRGPSVPGLAIREVTPISAGVTAKTRLRF